VGAVTLRETDFAALTRPELERLAAEQAAVLDVIRKAADALGTARLSRHRADLLTLIAQAAAGTLTPGQVLATWLDL
jgi:hypothetical protein